jgi:UDP-glucose 4-epimerase
MSILITGVCGFIGANLANRLVEKDEIIIGIDNLSRGSLQNISSISENPNFHFIETDISDYDMFVKRVSSIHETHPITEVWHLAANSDIPAGIANSQVDLSDTFMTTFNTLKIMKELGIKIISFASTSAVYGNLGDRKLVEDIGPLFPISNYGAMKLASEALITATVENCIDAAYIFRFPNVIGMPATHGVIFDFIHKLLETPENLNVLGDGTQQKTYLHVDELIDAMFFVRNNSFERINYYNIGANDDGASVKFIAEEVVRALSPKATITYGEGNKGWIGDVPKFIYSVDKLLKLGWKPKLNSAQSLQKAISQIVENYSL